MSEAGLPARTRTWNHRLGGGSYILFNYGESIESLQQSGPLLRDGLSFERLHRLFLLGGLFKQVIHHLRRCTPKYRRGVALGYLIGVHGIVVVH